MKIGGHHEAIIAIHAPIGFDGNILYTFSREGRIKSI